MELPVPYLLLHCISLYQSVQVIIILQRLTNEDRPHAMARRSLGCPFFVWKMFLHPQEKLAGGCAD
jgi:hypothetical protein